MDWPPTLDTVLDACGHKHRRIVLVTLADQQQPLWVNDLVNEIIKHSYHMPPTEATNDIAKRIHVGLHEVHLPKLVDAGFIRYDPERELVGPTDEIEREDSHLSAVLAMDSELPTSF